MLDWGGAMGGYGHGDRLTRDWQSTHARIIGIIIAINNNKALASIPRHPKTPDMIDGFFDRHPTF
jgi:hypothetical protein